jgi:hypothetical protein
MPELMFDSTPVVVDQQTAQEVAASTRGGWITALTKAIADCRLTLGALESEERELASDVPSGAMIELASCRADSAGECRDRVARAAFRVLRQAAEGGLGDHLAPYVAAAVLHPHAYAEAQRKLVAPGQRSPWLRWADLAPEPAATRLRHLAETSVSRAA